MAKKNNALLKGLGIIGTGLAIAQIAKGQGGNRSANVTPVSSEIDTEKLKAAIANDSQLKEALRGLKGKDGTNGTNGVDGASIGMQTYFSKENFDTPITLNAPSVIVVNHNSVVTESVYQPNTYIIAPNCNYFEIAFERTLLHKDWAFEGFKMPVIENNGGMTIDIDWQNINGDIQVTNYLAGFSLLNHLFAVEYAGRKICFTRTEANKFFAVESQPNSSHQTIILSNFDALTVRNYYVEESATIYITDNCKWLSGSGDSIPVNQILVDSSKLKSLTFQYVGTNENWPTIAQPWILDTRTGGHLEDADGGTGLDYLTEQVFASYDKIVYGETPLGKRWDGFLFRGESKVVTTPDFLPYVRKQIIITSDNYDIASVKSLLKKNVEYKIINGTPTTGGVLVIQFGEIPKNYTARTQFTVKRGDGSVAIEPENSQFKNVIHFVLGDDNKFVVY